MKKWILVLLLVITSLLNAETKVLAFAGSSREDSVNKKLVSQAAQIAKDLGATVTVIDLKDYPIPLYDADLESKEGMPDNAKFIRRLMIESQAILIASPEYNKSVSALLKNVLDWTSRSENGQPSRAAYQGKKYAIMSASPGNSGGARGLIHLRDIIEDIKGTVVPQQVSIPQAYEAFDENGRLKDPALTNQLKQLVSTAVLEK